MAYVIDCVDGMQVRGETMDELRTNAEARRGLSPRRGPRPRGHHGHRPRRMRRRRPVADSA